MHERRGSQQTTEIRLVKRNTNVKLFLVTPCPIIRGTEGEMVVVHFGSISRKKMKTENKEKTSYAHKLLEADFYNDCKHGVLGSLLVI